MKHLILAYSFVSYSSGLLSLIVLIIAFLKVRLRKLLFLLLFILMETFQLLYLGYYQYLYINNIPVLFHDYHFVFIYSLISFTIIILPMLVNELCDISLRRPINYSFGVMFLIGLACIMTPYLKGYLSAGVSIYFFARFKVYLIFSLGAALYGFLTLIINIKKVKDTKDRILFLNLAFIILVTAFQLVSPVFKAFPESVLVFATCYLYFNILLVKYSFDKFFQSFRLKHSDLLKKFFTEQKITEREKEIMVMMALGLSNKDIGARLFITEATVKTHIKNIYKKLNIRNRIQLFNLLKEKESINQNEIT